MAAPHPRRILWLLSAATLIPIIVLSWLGMRILGQDREVERAAEREALEVAAGRLALDIERRLQEVEEKLSRGAGIVFSPDGAISSPESPLLYQPAGSNTAAEAASSMFSEGEAAEFQASDFSRAASAYRRLAGAREPNVRAGALVRLGRALRKSGDRAGALRAYDDLEKLGAVSVAGQPAALVARQGRARLYEEAGNREGLQREATELGQALNAGGWKIDRATFEIYADMVRRWGATPPMPMAVARTEAAIGLWQSWSKGELPLRGRRIVRGAAEPMLALWLGGPERPIVWLKTAGELDVWLDPVRSSHAVQASAADVDGGRLFGQPVPGSVSLLPADTRLPFVLSVAQRDGSLDGGRGRLRRTVLVSGLLVAFVLMAAAAYGAYRATSRELLLARQQGDFVSAVSHEFRTPLTSMRHLLDLLASRGVTSEERRNQSYDLLTHETERLHRLVESLLSFGRIEAGAYAWRLEPLDPGVLVEALLADFRRDPLARGRSILCEVEEGLPLVQADREALSRSVWNLVENAAKYSEPETEIRVFARRAGDILQIEVVDQGVGIRPEERNRIFQKFVRGADARRAGIRGVGIGLAFVDQIVKAHGGRVDVESAPGEGSTFTIVLPALPNLQSEMNVSSSLNLKSEMNLKSEI